MPEKPTYKELEKRVRELERAESERKQAVAALEQERQRYRQILDSLPFGIYIVGRNYRIEYVNPSIRQGSKDPSRLKCHEYFHDFGEPCPWCPNPSVFQGETVHWEWYSEKTGVDYELIDLPLPNADGSISKLEIFRDITDRKKAEAALRDREEKYRLLVEHAKEAILVAQEGVIVFANPEGEALFGYTEAELASRPLVDLVHEQDRDLLVQRNKARMKGEAAPDAYSLKILRKSGEIRWVDLKLTLFSWNGRDAILCLVIDVTEQKQAEAALRRSENRFRSFVENANDFVFETTPEGEFTYVSPAWLAFVSETESEALGKSFELYVHPDDLPRCREYFRKVLTTGQKQGGVEYRVKDGSGAWHWHFTHGSPIRDAAGHVTRYLGIARDITEKKHAEQERERLGRQLYQAQKIEALGRMAGAVAHHYNNQLSVVLGRLELAMDSPGLDSRVQEDLKEAADAGRRASMISRQMLAYLGQNTGEKKRWDLSELCRRQLSALQSIVAGGVRLEMDLQRPGPLIDVNETEFQNALLGLVRNAWEAIETLSGSILLRSGTACHSELQGFRLYPTDWTPSENEYAFLEVSDTGCGIRGEAIDNIFDPFYSTKFTGRGLGLSVVLGMARARNGGVGVISEVNRGTALRIFIPPAGR